jgi:hypothetical protein
MGSAYPVVPVVAGIERPMAQSNVGGDEIAGIPGPKA